MEDIEKKSFDPNLSENKRELRIKRINHLVDGFVESSVVKKEDIPESYFQNQARQARELGHGNKEWTDELREQAIENIQT